MNPCPCGHYGDPEKECSCSPTMITRYQKRISGPILDRIDIHLEVPRVPVENLAGLANGEPSHAVRSRVEAARESQMMRMAVERMGLSARAYHRVLKLARTIADLEGSAPIQTPHLAEALQYRPNTGFLGG